MVIMCFYKCLLPEYVRHCHPITLNAEVGSKFKVLGSDVQVCWICSKEMYLFPDMEVSAGREREREKKVFDRVILQS